MKLTYKQEKFLSKLISEGRTSNHPAFAAATSGQYDLISKSVAGTLISELLNSRPTKKVDVPELDPVWVENRLNQIANDCLPFEVERIAKAKTLFAAGDIAGCWEIVSLSF